MSSRLSAQFERCCAALHPTPSACQVRYLLLTICLAVPGYDAKTHVQHDFSEDSGLCMRRPAPIDRVAHHMDCQQLTMQSRSLPATLIRFLWVGPILTSDTVTRCHPNLAADLAAQVCVAHPFASDSLSLCSLIAYGREVQGAQVLVDSGLPTAEVWPSSEALVLYILLLFIDLFTIYLFACLPACPACITDLSWNPPPPFLQAPYLPL